MGLQHFLDAMGDAAQTERTNYHVTLGQLIGALEDVATDDLPVEFEDGTSPGTLRSYRGYYSDLAFSESEEPTTVETLLDEAREANGSEFMGYKGGQFMMNDQTPLWLAEWSHLGDPIISIEHTDDCMQLVCGER